MAATDLERLHPVRARELGAGLRDVLVEEPEAAEGAQAELEPGADVEVHACLADVACRERVVEDRGRTLEQRDLAGVGGPVVLVAERLLARAQAGALQQAVDCLAAAL